MHCQKCRTPITNDVSLDELNPAAFKLLTESARPSQGQLPPQTSQSRPTFPQIREETYNQASRDAKAPTFKRIVPSSRYGQGAGAGARSTLKDNPHMSFVMLSDSHVVQGPSGSKGFDRARSLTDGARQSSKSGQSDRGSLLSDKMETANRLFEILSARSDIDHPICVECGELLIDGLQKRLASASRERDAYAEYLRQANQDIPTEEEKQQAREQLDVVLKREEAAFTELERLEKEKESIDEEIASLDAEARGLDAEEEEFWKQRNSFTAALTDFQNERDRINTKFDNDSKQLQRLQRTNVYNDTFCIGHDGIFGTINGLRLGRLSNSPVEWSEINAAWGQTCLLLATVAEKLNFTFQNYRLSPMGSTSAIEKLDYPQPQSTSDPAQPTKPKVTVLDLYCNSDLPLGFGFLHRRFDQGMVAFLECLRQLGHFVEQTTPHGSGGAVLGVNMPYTIQKDKINGVSIKLPSFGQDELWTKACKYTLTCCKYLLAHASNISSTSEIRRRIGAG
ncbi:beclin-like protein [Lineolata rhizophorae]|uniref:Beclin-like protein n=1 Tax=Lineolata rhizophorae TaxID=578093 RepID=A0A6A6P925_9PEZI|nr:beclin-like protein [Lineolata rhizophorae]